MIFENNAIAFELDEVFYVNQKNAKNYNAERPLDALSFRISADSVIKTENQSYRLSDGSVLFVPAFVDYSRTAHHDQMIVIHLKVFNYRSSKIEVVTPENTKKIQELFEKVLEKWNSGKNKFACSALIYEIFEQLYKQSNSDKIRNPKIAESVRYIHEHFTDADFSISKAAEKSFITDVYFRKLFKEEFGISPKKYLDDMRIKHASDLLRSGYYSLQEVSQMSGFADYKYFSVAFKSAVGVSPSKY